MKQIFKKYRYDFEQLVNVTYKLARQEDVLSERKHIVILKSLVSKLDRRNNYLLSKDDIRQNYTILWYKLVENFKKTNGRYTLQHYLLYNSIFLGRNMIQAHWRVIDSYEAPEFGTSSMSGLKWLMSPDECSLPLTQYEKYLLYMRYFQEHNVFKLAKIINKHRITLTKELEIIKERLKEDYYGKEDTTGSC